MSDPTKAAQGINAANKAQSSQALIIQAYANSVNEQPAVDFSGEPNLATYQAQINNGLATAQSHAKNYLNSIQPSIIQNIYPTSAITMLCTMPLRPRCPKVPRKNNG